MNLNLLPDLALFVQIVDQGSPPSPARTALPLQPLAAACHGWSEDGLQTAAAYHPQAAS